MKGLMTEKKKRRADTEEEEDELGICCACFKMSADVFDGLCDNCYAEGVKIRTGRRPRTKRKKRKRKREKKNEPN